MNVAIRLSTRLSSELWLTLRQRDTSGVTVAIVRADDIWSKQLISQTSTAPHFNLPIGARFALGCGRSH